jgi:hypothetical protein
VVDAVHKRLARNDVLGLKIPYSPKYHEVTLDFTDYAAKIIIRDPPRPIFLNKSLL